MTRTNYIRTIYAIINRLGLNKEELALQYSYGRTELLREMHDVEIREMARELRKAAPDPADKMRKKILSMAHEMNWELHSGKVNMAKVNAWCMKYGQYHKPLMDHTRNELAHLVTQFEHGPYKSYLQSIRK